MLYKDLLDFLRKIPVADYKNTLVKIPYQTFMNEPSILDKRQTTFVNVSASIMQKEDFGFYMSVVGGGGVGKSSVAKEVIKSALRVSEKNVMVVAPTHTALTNLRNKIPIDSSRLAFTTLAKMLKSIPKMGLDGTKSFYSSGDFEFEDTIFLFDEASFITSYDYSKLSEGIIDNNNLLICFGDDAQLPAPKSGFVSPFVNMALLDKYSLSLKENRPNLPFNKNYLRLTKCYRSDGESIVKFGNHIRGFVNPDGYPSDIKQHPFISWLKDQYAKGTLDHRQFSFMNESQLYSDEFMSLVREKGGGIRYIAYENSKVNEFASNVLSYTCNDEDLPVEQVYYLNEPFMRSERTIFDNSEIATITAKDEKAKYIALEPYKDKVSLALNGFVKTPAVAKLKAIIEDWEDKSYTPQHSEFYRNGVPHLKYRSIRVKSISNGDKANQDCHYITKDSMGAYNEWLEYINCIAEVLKAKGTGFNQMAIELYKARQKVTDAFIWLRWVGAITGHKSQGSEFDVVILDIKSILSCKVPFERVRLLYVAATRAKKHVIFLI